MGSFLGYIKMHKKHKHHELNQALEKRHHIQKESFIFMLKMVLIIGAPAFFAAYFGKKIGINTGHHPMIMILAMGAALLLSWALIIFKFFDINKKISENEYKIKKLRDEQNKYNGTFENNPSQS